MATLPLTITIRDFRYQKDITVPSAPLISQAPIVPAPSFVETPPPVSEVRIVKILPENTIRLPDANEGETISISASIYCKSAGTITKPRDTAYLIVDGAVADEKPISDGTVTFQWAATSVPINIHRICIKVNPTESCKSPGQDCKSLMVKPTTLSSSEQLARERESAREQRQLLEQAKQTLRQEIISGIPQEIPSAPVSIPYTPTIPSIPTEVPTTPPSAPPIPETGSIQIVGIPIPITPAMPVYLYIDGSNTGRVYEIPKTITNVSVGSHAVYIKSGEFSSPPRSVFVSKDQTSTVTI